MWNFKFDFVVAVENKDKFLPNLAARSFECFTRCPECTIHQNLFTFKESLLGGGNVMSILNTHNHKSPCSVWVCEWALFIVANWEFKMTYCHIFALDKDICVCVFDSLLALLWLRPPSPSRGFSIYLYSTQTHTQYDIQLMSVKGERQSCFLGEKPFYNPLITSNLSFPGKLHTHTHRH